MILALLAGGFPLVTVATCDRTAYGGSGSLFSTNTDLLSDTLDFVNGGDDDDDDD